MVLMLKTMLVADHAQCHVEPPRSSTSSHGKPSQVSHQASTVTAPISQIWRLMATKCTVASV